MSAREHGADPAGDGGTDRVADGGADPRVPLPRRAERAHLAPQLRSVGPAPTGTAFEAFGGPAAEHPAEAAAPAPRGAAADAVAARRRARAGGAGR